MKNKKELFNILSSINISNGKNLLKIIFHQGSWTDVYVTNIFGEDKKENDLKINIDEMIKDNIIFPKYGFIEIEIWVKYSKILKTCINKTNRIHNKKLGE
jgi:hypothetical protein